MGHFGAHFGVIFNSHLINYFVHLGNILSLYIKMKITNTRSEDLVEITINNDLTEDDKTYID